LLAGIDAPTLVIAGAEDAIIPPEVHRQFAGKIPGADLRIIEGAGHLPPLEQPDAFNRAVADFLKSVG
jgi:3-oxoadipate enol-lactonase